MERCLLAADDARISAASGCVEHQWRLLAAFGHQFSWLERLGSCSHELLVPTCALGLGRELHPEPPGTLRAIIPRELHAQPDARP